MTRLTDLYHRQFLGKSPKDFVEKPWLPKDKQSDGVHSNHSVIKLNSVFVETVDDGYSNRGYGAMAGGLLAIVPVSFLLWVATKKAFWSEGFVSSFLLAAFFFIGLVVCVFIVRGDCFAHTHYPIRYNRKSRRVYAWRPNGKSIKAKWDDLCFFPMPRSHPLAERLIIAAILSADKCKIEDMFFLGVSGGDEDQNRMYIEFLRCYLNQGPEELLKHPIALQPRLDLQKESFAHGYRQIMLQLNGLVLFQLILFPFFFVQSIFRWLAMRTSNIPVWPEWVEAECQIDADDPWVRDVSTHPIATNK